MRIGIATDHGGFGLKEDLRGRLAAAGHEIVDFGADHLEPGDDYPDFVVPWLGPWPQERWNAESPSVAVVSAPRSAPTRCREPERV